MLKAANDESDPMYVVQVYLSQVDMVELKGGYAHTNDKLHVKIC